MTLKALAEQAARAGGAVTAPAPEPGAGRRPGRRRPGNVRHGNVPVPGPRPGRATADGGPAGSDGAAGVTDPSAGLPPVIAAPPGLRRRLRGRRRGADQPPPAPPAEDHRSYDRPAPPAGVNPIGSLARPGRATVEGRVRAVEIRPVERNSVLAVDVSDSTGDLTALFYGRSHIPGVVCGARVRFRGPVGLRRKVPS